MQRHPWMFSGAIERVDGDPAAGATVDVVDAAGAFLARAAYSPLSQIRARAWSFDSTQALDASFFANAIARACAARQPLLDAAHTACRLVHGESDELPGVIADRYGDTIVVQLLSAGAERGAKRLRTPRRRDRRSLRIRAVGCRGRAARRSVAPRGRRCAAPCPESSISSKPVFATASTSSAGRRPGSISTSATTAPSSAPTHAAAA